MGFLIGIRITQQESANYLIERAGLSHLQSNKSREAKSKSASKSKKSKTITPAQEDIAPPPLPLSPEDEQTLDAEWVTFDASIHEQAANNLQKRGLLEAVLEGLLKVKVHAKYSTMAFEVTGPAGECLNYKSRDLRDPLPQGVPRYRYLVKDKGAYAWCSPDLTKSTKELWIEGELNGAAVAYALKGTEFGVQGIASTSGSPHLNHLIGQQKIIYIYADPDSPGNNARTKWENLAFKKGQTVIQLPHSMFKLEGNIDQPDACDVLGEQGIEALRNRLTEAFRALESVKVMMDNDNGYAISGSRLLLLKRDHRTQAIRETLLADFVAFIEEQQNRVESTGETEVTYVLSGRTPRNKRLPQITFPAGEFSSATVLKRRWGASATLFGRRWEQVAAAIEIFSKLRGIKEETVLTHTGWHKHTRAGWVFLTSGSVIGSKGAVSGILVDLPDSLRRVSLPDPPQGEEEKVACRRSLSLLELVPDHVGIPALGALYRSPLGTLNASVIFYGGTGRRKTTFLALLMAHFGRNFDLNRPMTGWNSTVNFIQLLLYAAKDILALIDDYKPHAMAKGEAARSEATFTQTIQSVADGGGKGTLTIDRRERTIVYPRGTLVSSAEDVPAGQSNQARCVLIHVDQDLLGEHQERSQAFREAADAASEDGFSSAMSGYIRFLAEHYEEVRVGSSLHREHVRHHAPYFPGAHGRNGEAAAELSFGWRVFLSYAVHIGAITVRDAQERWERICHQLQNVVGQQGAFHEAQDAVDLALRDLQTLLTQGKAYLRDLETGEAPPYAKLAGWESRRFEENDVWDHAPTAQHLGWLTTEGQQCWVYLMPSATYAALQQFAHQQSRHLPSETALWSLFQDRFFPQDLMRCDEQGKRRTKKVNIRHQDRAMRCLVLAFPLDDLLSGNGGNGGNNKYQTSTETANSLFPSLVLVGEVDGNAGKTKDIPEQPEIPKTEPSEDIEKPTLEYVDL